MKSKIKGPVSILKVIITVYVVISISAACKKETEKIMKVTNDSISYITSTSAKANATIVDIGQGIQQHGHCWSTEAEPTILTNNGITENGQVNSVGVYCSFLTGLTPGTKYYVRAYAENHGNVVYGADILPFTTSSISMPGVTTGEVTHLSKSGATVTGSLTSLGQGSSSVTQYGHCWSSETTTPVIEDDNKSSLGSTSETGNFESLLVGLSESTAYYVRAYATNDAGTAYGDTLRFTTYGQINAEFDANPKSGYLPLSVQFTDRSIGDINSWSWNFGDLGTSNAENPLHTYNDPGNYTVTLTVSDGISSDYETKVNFISVSASGTAPVANFSADRTLITEGENVNFTDQSVNDPTSWSWNFGDGGTSTSQNPSHQYNNEGVYTVSLSVSNSHGSNLETKDNYITVQSEVTETVTDYDGNEYSIVQIGQQIWMAENLKTAHYSNGAALINGSGAGNISGDYTTKYYFAYNDNGGNVSTYGRLYTWAAAMNGAQSSNNKPSGIQGVCPSGWHLPSDNEWKELEMFLGMSQADADNQLWRGTDEGGKLKGTGTSYWNSPNTGATNESGFTALPSGYRYFEGTYHYMKDCGFYWSSTESGSQNAYFRDVCYDRADIFRDPSYKWSAFSVRCIKDK
ncbi:MAG: PKD domain-containing protein [Bacteroidales bacterium]|nr:MAG: PKD domain-containing protein [Bacteroidales bacterium]